MLSLIPKMGNRIVGCAKRPLFPAKATHSPPVRRPGQPRGSLRVASGWLRGAYRLATRWPEGGLGVASTRTSAFCLLHFLPSPPKCPGPWPATPTFHENRLDDVQIGGKGIRRSHTAGLAQFQQRAKHLSLTPGSATHPCVCICFCLCSGKSEITSAGTAQGKLESKLVA